MARKKKQLTRKQRKQQRREAMERKRKERGWEPPPAGPAPGIDGVFEDMLPLFPEIDAPNTPSISTAERLLTTLMASDSMADEPEFKEIFVDPMLCLDTFSEIVQEMGIEPESMSKLPDEEREDAQMTIREEITRRLLTDELRQDIIDGLNDLRLRLKQSGGHQEKVAQAAMLQSFLTSASPVEPGGDMGSGIWPMLGLVQAIFMRGLMIGFELMEAAREVEETLGLDESEVALPEALAQSSILRQKVDSLLKKVPGLLGFMKKHTDKAWEEGVDALFTGDLYLELYSPEELATAFDIFGAAFRPDLAEEIETQDPLQLKVAEKEFAALIQQLDDYLTQLFTPERLDRLRARLAVTLKDPAYKKWLGFLYILVEYMANENAVEIEMRFLLQALLGEIKMATAEFQEADE